SSSEARKTCAQPEARKPSFARVDPVLPSAFFLITSCCKQQHSPADFLLIVNDLDVRHVNPLQEQHDLARTADQFHEHIAGAAIALANGVAKKFRYGQLGTVRIFIAHWAIHPFSHEIARLDSHQVIELQLSAVNALQDRHGDVLLAN